MRQMAISIITAIIFALNVTGLLVWQDKFSGSPVIFDAFYNLLVC